MLRSTLPISLTSFVTSVSCALEMRGMDRLRDWRGAPDHAATTATRAARHVRRECASVSCCLVLTKFRALRSISDAQFIVIVEKDGM